MGRREGEEEKKSEEVEGGGKGEGRVWGGRGGGKQGEVKEIQGHIVGGGDRAGGGGSLRKN